MRLSKQINEQTFQSKKILIIAGLFISAHIGYAQSFKTEKTIASSFDEVIENPKKYHIAFGNTFVLDNFQNSLIQKRLEFLSSEYNLAPFDSTKNARFPNLIQINESRKTLPNGYLEIYAISSESTYLNLIARRYAALAFKYQKNNFIAEVDFIANRYETMYATTQFGLSIFLQYRFSPHWSMGLWGTIYSRNPYFNMAAFPFVNSSSFGGWVKYEDESIGIKLGSRSYYDSFQRRWKWEPIITPSVKINKKVILEIPVGPMVQKSMERILKKSNTNGPMIVPDFN